MERASTRPNLPYAAVPSVVPEDPLKHTDIKVIPALYTDPGSIFEALERRKRGVLEVKLLKESWLQEVTYWQGFPLPRRQELEEKYPDAFYTSEEVETLPRGPQGQLPIVVASYVWESAAHADPRSEQLLTLMAVVER